MKTEQWKFLLLATDTLCILTSILPNIIRDYI